MDTRTPEIINKEVEKQRASSIVAGLVFVSVLLYFEFFYFAAAGAFYTVYVAFYGASSVVEKWKHTIRWHARKERTDYFRVYSTSYDKREVATALTRMQRTKFGFCILFTSFVLSFFYETGAYILLTVTPFLIFYIRYSADEIPWQSQL